MEEERGGGSHNPALMVTLGSTQCEPGALMAALHQEDRRRVRTLTFGPHTKIPMHHLCNASAGEAVFGMGAKAGGPLG